MNASSALGTLAYSASEPTGLASRRLDRWGARIAWLIIFAAVGLSAYHAVEYTRTMDRLTSGAAGGAADRIPAHRINPTLTMQAKALVGMRQVVGSEEGKLTDELRSSARTPAEQVWIVPVLAEVDGKDVALKQLEAAVAARGTVPAPVVRDADDLRMLYQNGVDSLSPEQRTRLVNRLGWSGKLALTFGQKETDARRSELLDEASAFSATQLLIVLGVILAAVVGLVLLIVAIVKLSRRRLRLQYEAEIQPGSATGEAVSAPASVGAPSWMLSPLPPPMAQPSTPPYGVPQQAAPPIYGQGYGWPPGQFPYGMTPPASWFPPAAPPPYKLGKLGDANGRTGPFIEAFAVYLLTYIGSGYLLHELLDLGRLGWSQWLGFLAAPIAMTWPWLRGVRGPAWRRGFGWTRGRGVIREMFSGVVAYIAGLPIFGLGMISVIVLQKMTHTHSYHPITTETGGVDGSFWAALNLWLIAAVGAPIVEETFFRGAMFHHLRSRWSWVMTAIISSLIFAGVHPQGWVAIPALASLAIVFSAMREWRSSCIASMTAHAMHNGTLVILLLLGTM